MQDCAGQSVVAESHRDHVPRLLGAAEIYVRQRIALVKGVFAHAGDALRELYLFQAGTAPEQVLADLCDACRNNRFRQR